MEDESKLRLFANESPVHTEIQMHAHQLRQDMRYARYRHFKSGVIYMVIDLAVDAQDVPFINVIYRQPLTGYIYSRPLADFFDTVETLDGKTTHRFTKVEEQ